MDYSKTPMDTPNMHGIPKEEQLDLLDPGEQPVDSGEHFHGSFVAFQDADLLDCHQEFDRITFVENIHIGISDLSMSPKLATSIIWKLKNKGPPSIIPELQKDVIPKLLPIESKVWRPGEPNCHFPHYVPFEQPTVLSAQERVTPIVFKQQEQECHHLGSRTQEI
jgi:hypothetical protein